MGSLLLVRSEVIGAFGLIQVMVIRGLGSGQNQDFSPLENVSPFPIFRKTLEIPKFSAIREMRLRRESRVQKSARADAAQRAAFPTSNFLNRNV